MSKLWRITHKLSEELYLETETELTEFHIDKIHKNNDSFLSIPVASFKTLQVSTLFPGQFCKFVGASGKQNYLEIYQIYAGMRS